MSMDLYGARRAEEAWEAEKRPGSEKLGHGQDAIAMNRRNLPPKHLFSSTYLPTYLPAYTLEGAHPQSSGRHVLLLYWRDVLYTDLKHTLK